MPKHAVAKFIAVLVAAACLTLGIVGLVLPVIPGVLFLALAVALIARHWSLAGERLRRHRGIRRALDHADGFIDADPVSKLKLSALYAAKAAVDGLDLAARALDRWRNRRRKNQSTFVT